MTQVSVTIPICLPSPALVSPKLYLQCTKPLCTVRGHRVAHTQPAAILTANQPFYAIDMSTTIKFNAGKVQYDSETHKCTPLPHKGTVTIAPSVDDEGFFDFVWTPKSDSGVEKDELLIIPGDMTFSRVKSCKTGRIVALTFLCSGDKSLYWLQDVGDDDMLDKWTDKDLSLLSSVQKLIAPEDDEEVAAPAEVKQE